MSRENQLAMIGGSVHPYDKRDPLDKALSYSIEQGAGDSVLGLADWYKKHYDAKTEISTDLLRLLADNVRNTTENQKKQQYIPLGTNESQSALGGFQAPPT